MHMFGAPPSSSAGFSGHLPAHGVPPRKSAVVLAVCALAFFCFWGQTALAVPPKYFDTHDAHVTIESDRIMAKIAIGVDNVTGVYEMLKDGASLELLVHAKLVRVRTLWANVTLAEKEFVSSLNHNQLTREFALVMPGAATPVIDKNLERLLAATWNQFVFPIADVSVLDGEKNTEYRIILTLNLNHATPPPWLAKDFMFWTKKILDPETIKLPFRY